MLLSAHLQNRELEYARKISEKSVVSEFLGLIAFLTMNYFKMPNRTKGDCKEVENWNT